MLLREAVDFAAMQSAPWDASFREEEHRAGVSRAIAAAFWTFVWPGIREERLKLSIWFIRPSVKVAALKPFFERVFGEAPADA